MKKIMVLVMISLLVGCTALQQQQQVPSGVMKQFDSFEQLKEYVETRAERQDFYPLAGFGGVRVMKELSAVPSPAMAGEDSSYSTTNVQIEGIDEADIVKTDGSYIYLIADNKLLIYDAREDAELIATVEIPYEKNSPESYVKQLFIDGNHLALFVETYEKTLYFQQYDIQPQEMYRPVTEVHLYDISDRSNPLEQELFEFSGSYYQSRLINGIVYVVAQENVWQGPIILEPFVKANSIMRPDIFYFDDSAELSNFNTVASIDLKAGSVIDTKTYLLGYSTTLMVSENNIYIGYQHYEPWKTGYEKDRFFEAILPNLEGDLHQDIQRIIAQVPDHEEQWRQISVRLAQFFQQQDLKEHETMLERVADAVEKYDFEKQLRNSKTILYRLEIDSGQIEYGAHGEVAGRLLNQFSLDEKDGYLRCATTVELWGRKPVQYNNVYVLDNDMDVVGTLTNVAEDERIYSTRFIDDRLYMVTFKRIDPFFVIDLSNPRNPEVLGELKIPGYSDYLHPYDENHIIGIGKDVDEDGTVGGIKIALFNVQDTSDPRLVDSVIIGDSGSDSPVLRDHKSFLLDRRNNLLVIPVAEIQERHKVSPYHYSHSVWHGAYVFEISEHGFEEKGTVEHDKVRTDYFNWWDQATVLRSLYIDDRLYTISTKSMIVSDIDSLDEIKDVSLPHTREQYYYRVF